VVLDLEADDGKVALRRLVEGADVLVESAGPGVMDRMGLGYESLAALNPALVHVSISGFGEDGPKATWRAPDLVVAAAAGPLLMTGDEDRPPLRISLPQAYHHAAADAAGAALIALHERDNRSGLGQHIDISAQQSFSVATQSFLLSAPAHGSEATRVGGGVRLGGLDTKIQFLWPCKDGQVSVTFLFGAAIGPFTRNLMEWVYEEGCCDAATRDKDWIEYGNMLYAGTEPISEYERIKALLETFFVTKTKAELFQATFDRHVLIAPVADPRDVVENPHWVARKAWDDVRCVDGGTYRFPGRFVEAQPVPLPTLGAAPRLGEHTAAVLAEPRRRPSVPAALGRPTPLAGDERAKLPLAGLKVADFMWVFAGPWSTRVLADYGATVVRVESVRSFDALRTAGNFQDDRNEVEWAIQFQNVNAGKLGLTLDLSKPQAREVAFDLVRWADVTTESFSPRAMRAWGLDYAQLCKVKPDLVMASSCLMGQYGPQSLLAGFGTAGAAVSGMFHLTGWPDRLPCGPALAYTDYTSPRFLVLAILAALDHRRRTGQGCHLDLSQAQASHHFLATALLDYTVNGRVAQRQGNDDTMFAPHGVYPAAGTDRWLAIAVTVDEEWRMLCEVLGRADLGDLNARQRLDRRRELDEVVSAWTAGQDAGVAMCRLQELGVPAHLVQGAQDAFADPQLRHRGHFVEVDHELMGRTWVEGSRYRLSRTPAVITRGAHTLGGDTWQVLTELLGYSDDKVAELAAAEIFE
jgi:crotonobetainyl-CoA:carnitine CoA-transferase CaiB-like acyl-CoA transferase